MDVLDRVESIRGARQKKRVEGRVDDVEHENDRLHVENESLRDQLHQERAELSRILDAALELPPERRAAYLDEACAGDSRLRSAAESMLAAADHATELQDTVVIGSVKADNQQACRNPSLLRRA